jgi:beta-lactamase class A
MRRNTIAGILLCLVCLSSMGFLWRREPSLWKNRDAGLQHAFTEALEKEFQVGGAFREGISEKRIGIALVDITVPSRPRVAEFNGDVMIYAASLPKIAILLGALVEVERGKLELDEKLRASLTRMIRESSNEDATGK